jgi:aminomethyltransferase
MGTGIALGIWEAMMEAGEPMGIVPTGLGARDTLRLEAGMPLYGHELSEDIHPFQAGLGYACHLVGYDFPGRDALIKIQKEPLQFTRVGLELPGGRVPRQGCPILADSRRIGEVTSGTFSPTLQKPIAMGYVPPEFAEAGRKLQVDIRGHLANARVVPLPFYNHNHKKGNKK